MRRVQEIQAAGRDNVRVEKERDTGVSHGERGERDTWKGRIRGWMGRKGDQGERGKRGEKTTGRCRGSMRFPSSSLPQLPLR